MAAAVQFLVGADPELFLRRDGKIVSAHDILPGTKHEPYKVKQGAIQVDGVAAEFNIEPAKSAEYFVHNVKTVMDQLKEHAKGAEFIIEPYATFDQSYFDALPPEVRELGCNPDYNAWTGQVNPPPDASGYTRVAAGHLHAGWCTGVDPFSKFHFEDCCTFIKQLDYYIGIYSLMWDPDPTRRKMYGKAGAFRPKSYGAEYRTPSNVWLKSPLIQTWLYQAVQYAAGQLMNGNKTMEEQFGDYAQRVINENEIEWYKTPEGQKVHNAMGMGYPDLRELKPKKEKKELGMSSEEYLEYVEKMKGMIKSNKKKYTINSFSTANSNIVIEA